MLHLVPTLLAVTALGAPLRGPAPAQPAAGPMQLTAVSVGGSVSVAVGVSARYTLAAAAPARHLRLAPDLARGADPVASMTPPSSGWAVVAAAFVLPAPAAGRPALGGPRAGPAGRAPPAPWHPG